MDNLIGLDLGRYHILEPLGQGGMATVFKAYDTLLERNVALKIIRMEMFGSAVLENLLKRFEREAKALANLLHPNIVSVIDYGNYKASPYLVMPYLPGGTLKQRLGKPMPWQYATRLLLPIAHALQYAHDQGIIHRDVKPSNILITKSGDPMLTDFGIAKVLGGEEGQTLTEVGTGIGTPEYMAPEQWVGTVTVQSDVYSLGVVLYEMVAGRTPYKADTAAAVAIKQASEPLPRPGQFVPGLPGGVEKVLCKALEKQPKDRYLTMGDFVNALNGMLGEIDQTIPVQKPQMEVSPVSQLFKGKQGGLVIQTEGGTVIRPAQPEGGYARPEKPARQFSRLILMIGGFVMGAIIIGLLSSLLFRQGAILLPTSMPATIASQSTVPLIATLTEPLIDTTINKAYTPTLAQTASPVPGIFPSDAPIKLTYMSGAVLESQNADVYVANEDGSGILCVACSSFYEGEPSLSGDGEWVVYQAVDASGHTDIYKVPSTGGSAINLTRTPTESEREPTFSHDGSRIAYQLGASDARTENGEIYIMDSNGGTRFSIGQKGRGPTWSPDDKNLAFMQYGSDKTWQIIIYSFSTGKSKKITSMSNNARWPCWSPDSKFIAFNSTDKYLNPDAIWIVLADGSDSPRMVTRGSAGRPSWSTNGLISFNITDTGIQVIQPDGSNQMRLIPDKDAYASSWSR